MSTLPQLSLGTAALLIFGVCAGFIMLRGISRILIGTVVLALSAWLAFLAWQAAPALSVEWTGHSLAAITIGLPLAVFFAAFIVIRRILTMLARPFGSPDKADAGTSFSPAWLGVRLLFSLLPASLLCLIGATILHHAGSVAEIRAYAEKSLGLTESIPGAYFKSLKSSIEATLPASLLRFLDPLAEPSRIAMAKAISDQSAGPFKPVIDPATGKPIPRAIVVESPELTRLARSGNYGDLLRHPVLTQIVKPTP